MIACERGHMSVVRFLIENGADVHCSEKSGDTALLWAAYSGNLPITKYLLEGCDADVNIRNKVHACN